MNPTDPMRDDEVANAATAAPTRAPVKPPERDAADTVDSPASTAPDTDANSSQPAPQDAAQSPATPSGISGWWAGNRHYLIHHLPAFFVNNASNMVGVIQLVGEAFAFKSSGNDLMITPKGQRQWWQYITEPPLNMVKASLAKAKHHSTPASAKLPKLEGNFFRQLNDLKTASIVESAGNTLKLTNRWSARSGLTGMTSMAIAAALPDRKESAEETESMAQMAQNHTLQYVGKRLGQALNPLEWWDNKRQAAGLGMMATGVFSFLSGFRQVGGEFKAGAGGKNILAPQAYRKNHWHMLGGAITALAGTQLLLAINNQRGWVAYGTTQLGRLVTLPASIHSRFNTKETGNKEQGAVPYFLAQATFVVKNLTASLLGGAEIRPDGTVIDHAAMRKKALEDAKADKQEVAAKKHTSDTPSSKISSAAMPDKLSAHAENIAQSKVVA